MKLVQQTISAATGSGQDLIRYMEKMIDQAEVGDIVESVDITASDTGFFADENECYQVLLDAGISEDVINTVTGINGYSVETLNDIARYQFGMDIEQLAADMRGEV